MIANSSISLIATRISASFTTQEEWDSALDLILSQRNQKNSKNEPVLGFYWISTTELLVGTRVEDADAHEVNLVRLLYQRCTAHIEWVLRNAD